MKRILPLIIAIASLLHFTPAQAETVAQKAKETIIKARIDVDQAAPREILDFITRESGIKVFYTPPKDANAETRVSLGNLPEIVTADDALRYVALLANLSLVYEKDGAHLARKTGKAGAEPAAGKDWVRVVAAVPGSNAMGPGMLVFIRYSATKDGVPVFALPYYKGMEAPAATMGSAPLKAGTGGCVRGFVIPGGRVPPVDEVRAQMGDARSAFPVKFDGADPVKPVKDLSQFKTPSALYLYIVKLEHRVVRSREAFADNQRDVGLAAAWFLKHYPKDPLRWDVKLDNAKAALRLKPDADQGEALLEILTAPDVAADVKSEAAFYLTRNSIRLSADAGVATLIADYHTSHPGDWHDDTVAFLLEDRLNSLDDAAKETLLTALAKSDDKDIASQSAILLRAATAGKRLAELKTKPLDLKFTAVDGTEVDLSKLRGKVVLVDFWATWCGPCMAEMPAVLAAYKKYHDKGFEIVGISLDQDKDSLLQVTKDKGMVWPQYFDGKGWGNEISSSVRHQRHPRHVARGQEGNGRQPRSARSP